MEIKEIVSELCKEPSNKRRSFIQNFLEKNDIYYTLQDFTSGINIETVKNGSINEREIVLMAHYDVFNPASESANDNSSSVAVLMKMAQYLKKIKPKYKTCMVFNDNEEILGGLSAYSNSLKNLQIILDKSGSYFYLKNHHNRKKILFVIILEMSGIGDSIFIASNSGNISCNEEINDYCSKVADNNNFLYNIIPVLQSDYISVHILKLKGSVIGAIPFYDAKTYIDNYKKFGLKKDIYPHTWKKNHTSMDKVFSIQEKSLQMIFNYLLHLINNYK